MQDISEEERSRVRRWLEENAPRNALAQHQLRMKHLCKRLHLRIPSAMPVQSAIHLTISPYEMMEMSIVSIPSNPASLLEHYRRGATDS